MISVHAPTYVIYYTNHFILNHEWPFEYVLEFCLQKYFSLLIYFGGFVLNDKLEIPPISPHKKRKRKTKYSHFRQPNWILLWSKEMDVMVVISCLALRLYVSWAYYCCDENTKTQSNLGGKGCLTFMSWITVHCEAKTGSDAEVMELCCLLVCSSCFALYLLVLCQLGTS